MATVRPRYLPVPYQDLADGGRLILRDGSTALLRPARPEDKDAVGLFFDLLSQRSRYQRFFSASRPGDPLIADFCDNSNPQQRLTLLVSRRFNDGLRIVAVGSYIARDAESAELAMTVDDRFQGKGIGALLLERLAVLAARNGFRRLWATTLAENTPMLSVFRDSGFACRTRVQDGCAEVDLSVVPSETSVARAELRDRVSTTASLRPFFKPNAVAVIGASRNPANIGNRIVRGLAAAGFAGGIYPVNPHARFIEGRPCYPSVRALPETADLAVVAVARDAVSGVVDDCAARGVRALVVITAGFAETGMAGRKLQEELAQKVRGYGMRMVGPNCLGLLNADPQVRLNASFAPRFPPSGDVALCSQSGALGLAIIALARRRQLGMSSFVSVGNKADVSGNDLLQYWEEDPQTRVILLYLESFGNPRRFARIAARVGRHKPIVTVKAGRSRAGVRAAGSHTAALAGSDLAVEALFQQTGVIRADTLDEMFDLAAALSSQPLPAGQRVAILTNAGGLGILCADTCEASGLSVGELEESTRQRLKQFLPAAASVTNPVDTIASAGAEEFGKAVEVLLAAAEVDALIVLAIDIGLADLTALRQAIGAEVGAARRRGTPKPVLTCIMEENNTDERSGAAQAERLPNYAFPEHAARVLGKLARYAEWRREPAGTFPELDNIDPGTARLVCRQALQEHGDGWLAAEEVRRVLAAMGITQPAGRMCRSADEAAQFASTVGYPVALKLASRTIVHKTEFGGVRLNLDNPAAVRQAFKEIEGRLQRENRLAEMDGALVQPMISGGVELMIGVTQDPSFGPLLAFGLGGIHVEVLKDVVFRVMPITDLDARTMVRAIRGYPLLTGYRGHPAADIAAVEELLLRIARLVEEVPEIGELDLNPVMALAPGQGYRAVDARINVAAAPGAQQQPPDQPV